MIAAQHNPESAKLLIDAGAQLNSANQFGYTTLMYAKYDHKAISLLLNAGAQ